MVMCLGVRDVRMNNVESGVALPLAAGGVARPSNGVTQEASASMIVLMTTHGVRLIGVNCVCSGG